MKILLGIVLLLLLVTGGLFISKDSLVRSAVISGGDRVLGADSTRLSSASIDLFGGNLSLRGLELSNPEGYQQPNFFQLSGIDVELSMVSLLQDRIVLPRLELDGVEILVETFVDGEGPHLNLLTIQKEIKKSADQQAGSGSTDSGKKFVIDTLSVSGMKVAGVMTIPGGGSWDVDLSVPTFEIEGIGNKKNGIVLAQVMVVILDALLDKAIEKIETDGTQKLQVLGDAKNALDFLGKGLQGTGLDPAIGKKLLDEALKNSLGDLLKKKKEEKEKKED